MQESCIAPPKCGGFFPFRERGLKAPLCFVGAGVNLGHEPAPSWLDTSTPVGKSRLSPHIFFLPFPWSSQHQPHSKGPAWWETPTSACLFLLPPRNSPYRSLAVGAGRPWVPFVVVGTQVGAALGVPTAASAGGSRARGTQPSSAEFNYRN